jgi:hypothetical protein
VITGETGRKIQALVWREIVEELTAKVPVIQTALAQVS